MKYLNLNIIFVILIAGLVIYLLYRLIQKQNQNVARTGPQYTYNDDSTPQKTAELNKITITNPGSGITNFSQGSSSPYLRDYCIKSSSNTAFSGGYMNLEMIKYVLRRGCRFLDFDVFIKDDIPIVAYSNQILYDPSFNSFTSIDLPVSLEGVFKTIKSNAFSDTAPNPKDPLFVHLKIKTNLNDAFKNIAKLVDDDLKSVLFKGPVTPTTYVTDLMEKIVLIVDISTSPTYGNYPVCGSDKTSCFNLKNYVNMESGSDVLRLYSESEILQQTINPPDPSVYLMRIVYPSSNMVGITTNCDALNLIQKYGAQFTAQAFYKPDAKLKSYEAMFSKYKSAFVPMASAVKYVASQ
jgi:hypothetical protein